MKRCLILLIVAGVLLTSLSACSQPLTPYETYQKITEVSRQATSVSMRFAYGVSIQMGASGMEAHLEGDMRQVAHSDTDAAVAVHLTTDVPDVPAESFTYYRDGVLYQDMAGRRIRMEAEPEQLLDQLVATGFMFEGQAAVEGSQQDIAGSGDKQLSFTLSAGEMEPAAWELAQSVLVSMGLPRDDYEQVDPSFSDITYQLVFNPEYQMKSSAMWFTLDLTRGEEMVSLHYTVELMDIALNTLTDIDPPADLESYRDVQIVLKEELMQRNEELAAQLGPGYRPISSQYSITNSFGNDCNAAMLLQEEGEYLDYFFWLIYQTQTGISTPVPPNGFADPSELSAEGLLRLFCIANDDRIEEFADLEKEVYTVSDSLPPLFLAGVLQGYTYDPATLPAEYGREAATATFPIALCRPSANFCRIERVEVTDEQHLKITATGLMADFETPVNTQELVLSVPAQGRVLFESYSIRSI